MNGGAAGLGYETARVLAAAGAEVAIAARRLDAAQTAAQEIAEGMDNGAVHAAGLDLAELDSVKEFVGAWSGPLHILVNNAGVMATP